jgi:hypothetical protein
MNGIDLSKLSDEQLLELERSATQPGILDAIAAEKRRRGIQ